MANRHIFGISAWVYLAVGFVGGIAPDAGHFLNIVSNGAVSWDYFHHLTVLFAWVFGASIIGYAATVVLGRSK